MTMNRSHEIQYARGSTAQQHYDNIKAMLNSMLSPDIAHPNSSDFAAAGMGATPLLESFIPGFALARKIVLALFGFDLSQFVVLFLVLSVVWTGMGYVFKHAHEFLMVHVSSHVTINDSDELYSKILDWLSDQEYFERARYLTAGMDGGHRMRARQGLISPAGDEETDDTDFQLSDLFDNQIAAKYHPAYGYHSFWQNGRYYWIHREKKEFEHSKHDTKEETIRIYTFGRSNQPIKRMVKQILRDSLQKDSGATPIYCPEKYYDCWGFLRYQRNRPLDSLYLNKLMLDGFLSDVKEFLRPSSWAYYANRGIPYRRGYLFHGMPGTGKTSLAMSLAGLCNLRVYIVNAKDYSDATLAELFGTIKPRSVVIMEDVDAISITRARNNVKGKDKNKKNKKSKKKVSNQKSKDASDSSEDSDSESEDSGSGECKCTLSGLLNAIDGIAAQEGRILVMTTNDPAGLDPALLRPGRVDKVIHFGLMNQQMTMDMFVRTYGSSSTPATAHSCSVSKPKNPRAGPSHGEVLRLAQRFAERIPENVISPAELQGFMLVRRRDPASAVCDIDDWVKELLARKAEGRNVDGEGEAEQVREAARQAVSKVDVATDASNDSTNSSTDDAEATKEDTSTTADSDGVAVSETAADAPAGDAKTGAEKTKASDVGLGDAVNTFGFNFFVTDKSSS